MKFLTLSSLIIALTVLSSCDGANQDAVKKTVTAFYKALQKDDSLTIKTYYPDFDKLGGHYKSSSTEIKTIESIDGGKYDLELVNHFTNGFGKKFTQNIHFLLKKNPEKEADFIIYDTRGLYGFDETREYQFAVNTGFIERKNTLSDQEIVKKITEAEKLLEIMFKKRIESLRKEVVVENWGWEYGFIETYADGHGKVVNRSKDDFSTLKYVLTFVDDKGNVTQTDDGYLCYEKLKSGESKDFTTMTSDIGAATKAYIQINFDTYELLDQIYDAKYKGNEYKLL